jgi:formylglycine-generating enzyme required for sulfatase activity
LERKAYGEAEGSFLQASELYESEVEAATKLFRNEPAKVAGAARDQCERLSSLERELYGRVAEAARRVDGCERNLRSARTDDEREAIERRRLAAVAELDLMNRLKSLTRANVFDASLRAEITSELDNADQQLEEERYHDALVSYAQTKAWLEELLTWPDQAESALRRQAALSKEIEQVRSALGPIALELAQVQSALNDVTGQMTQGEQELSGGRVSEAIALFHSAHEHLSEVKADATTALLSQAMGDDRAGKRTDAVMALDELIALDPNHKAGQELRRKILSHRITNSIGMEFVFIPPGDLLMGSPSGELGRDEDERQQRLQIPKAFYMGTMEVTQAQWRAVMEDDPSRFKGDELPVEQVSWEEAVEFCRRLTAAQPIGMLGRYRLPTEAEWEYACRAGTSSPFSFGETITTAQANYDGDYAYGNGSKGIYRGETVPVASFPANGWGLYDTHGNVWEWCANSFEEDAQNNAAAATIEPAAQALVENASPDLSENVAPTPDRDRDRGRDRAAGFSPRGLQDQPESSILPSSRRQAMDESTEAAQLEGHILRGGSWRNRPRFCRCANRVTDTEGSALGNIGFRVLLESE